MRHRERELAVVASIVCGGLVAAALGGATWVGKAGVVLIVIVAVGLAGSGLVDRRRRRPEQPEVVEAVRPPAPEEVAHDTGIVTHVIGLIGPRDVRWLRDETFEVPWRGARIVPFERFAEEAVFLPHDPDLDTAVRVLVERTKDLVAYYDVNTFPEALVQAQEWREMRPDATAELTAAELAVLDERRAELRARAVGVARAFDDFAIAAERVTGSRLPG